MMITVEFFGVSRYVTGIKECQLEFEQGANLGDVVRELARQFPRLEQERLIENGPRLSPSFQLIIDGRGVTKELDTQLKGNERLLLVSATWGG
ncbi:MAG TPA: hypothetical protein ENO24_01900 [Chloroflexi bacterium]|nr:hypothetical protein [Chloroflexota bacterium]